MDKEIWKDIPNYEGRYQVSNYGNIRSLNHNQKGIIKEIKKTAFERVLLCETTKEWTKRRV